MKPYYIYYLLDPNGNVRYVGYSNKPFRRYQTHILQSQECRTHKECWINSLLQRGLTPSLSIKCIVQGPNEAKRIEILLIAAFKQRGIDLVNGTKGGDGSAGFKWSAENYKKHEAYWTPERREAESRRVKGKPQTEEHKRATLAANTPELLARRGASIKAGWERRNGAPTKPRIRPKFPNGYHLTRTIDSDVSPAEHLQRQIARSAEGWRV